MAATFFAFKEVVDNNCRKWLKVLSLHHLFTSFLGLDLVSRPFIVVALAMGPLERTDEFSILKANYCIHDKRSKVDSNVVEEEMGKHLVSNPFE